MVMVKTCLHKLLASNTIVIQFLVQSNLSTSKFYSVL